MAGPSSGLRTFTGGSWPAKGRIYQRPSTVANDVLISRCHSARIDKTHRGGRKKVQAKGKVKENTHKTRQEGTGMYRTGQYSRGERGVGGRKSIDEQPQNGWHNKWATGFRFACLLEARYTQRGVCSATGRGVRWEGREVKVSCCQSCACHACGQLLMSCLQCRTKVEFINLLG